MGRRVRNSLSKLEDLPHFAPLCSKPVTGEDLFIYLVVSNSALRPYYHAHRIIVMKWAIKLSRYDLLYRPKTTIKAQALVDFFVEFTLTTEEEKMVTKNKENSRAEGTSFNPDLPKDMWQLSLDGALNYKRARAGIIIITLRWNFVRTSHHTGLSSFKQEVEYEALLSGLGLAKELSIKKLVIYSDSQLITNQALSVRMAKHPRLIQYLDKVQMIMKEFPTFTIKQVPQAENTHVDALASLGSVLDT
ncbi:hypothetical protein L3X38_042567 [Prunus dulcis]|uniref:RNase H type-1 domain-containing protein n=1 Tax=Prunus dulcis TaxID=3755 RepID=A0AAD4UW62_PRUDU|nr:hypothetical protein L3X38_042567 [Prunus dulcis]